MKLYKSCEFYTSLEYFNEKSKEAFKQKKNILIKNK